MYREVFRLQPSLHLADGSIQLCASICDELVLESFELQIGQDNQYLHRLESQLLWPVLRFIITSIDAVVNCVLWVVTVTHLK